MSEVINFQHPFFSLFLSESFGEVRRAGDSSGVRFGHDSMQGAEAAGEP